jgi:hypothetical protein
MNDQPAKIGDFRHPVRNVNPEILSRLTIEDTQVRPLAGATGRRPSGAPDPRLTQLRPIVGGASSDEVTFYEHVATVRYKDASGDRFFVAFRQTMDALFLEQQDPEKYPEWLMKHPVKKTELSVYIYAVTRHWKEVPVLRSHEDWLAHIADPVIFDTLAYFLLSRGVISEDMYGRI